MTDDIVVISVFKCCTLDDGTYFGKGIHEVDIPSDGPWYVLILHGSTSLEFGFSTKADAMKVVDGLVRDGDVDYQITVDPWD